MKFGQAAMLPTIFIGILSTVGAVAGSWISASAASTEKLGDFKLEQSKVDSRQDNTIELLKSSACVQNQNIQIIGRALKVELIKDPNCK